MRMVVLWTTIARMSLQELTRAISSALLVHAALPAGPECPACPASDVAGVPRVLEARCQAEVAVSAGTALASILLACIIGVLLGWGLGHLAAGQRQVTLRKGPGLGAAAG